MRKATVLLIFLIVARTLAAIEIESLPRIYLEQGKDFLQSLGHLCITEDGLFIVTDGKAGNIKIYDRNGRLLNVWGRRGPGPDELGKPMLCEYQTGRLVFMDWDKRKIFVCRRKGKSDFTIVDGIFCLGLGTDMSLRGDKLLIAGSRDEGTKGYDLYVRDLSDKSYRYLVTREMKYNFSTLIEFRNQFRNQPDIRTIGIGGFCDWSESHAYLVWEGDLRIIRVNLKNRTTRVFGEKTGFYRQPRSTPKLIEAYSARDWRRIVTAKLDMSRVRAIFVGSKFFGIIYNIPSRLRDAHAYMVQFYRLDGNFIAETAIKGLEPPHYRMHFNKQLNRLYFLNTEPDGDDIGEERFVIIPYRIVE